MKLYVIVAGGGTSGTAAALCIRKNLHPSGLDGRELKKPLL